MKIYHDEDRRVIFVEGVGSFASEALKAVVVGDRIRIWTGDDSFKEAAPPWDIIEDRDGNTFASQSLALAYLNQEFAKTAIKTPSDISDFLANLDQGLN